MLQKNFANVSATSRCHLVVTLQPVVEGAVVVLLVVDVVLQEIKNIQYYAISWMLSTAWPEDWVKYAHFFHSNSGLAKKRLNFCNKAKFDIHDIYIKQILSLKIPITHYALKLHIQVKMWKNV